jgi:hypothetical protein
VRCLRAFFPENRLRLLAVLEVEALCTRVDSSARLLTCASSLPGWWNSILFGLVEEKAINRKILHTIWNLRVPAQSAVWGFDASELTEFMPHENRLFEPACLVASRSEEELREPRRLSLEGRKVEVVES